MAKKLFVIDSPTGQKVPFLRGVLVQSLVAVGLPFSDAYDIAHRVRGLLDASEETWDTVRLHKLVADEIEQGFGKERRRSYELGNEQARPVLCQAPESTRRISAAAGSPSR